MNREDISKLQHNGSFDIATGRSRKETHWKNKETNWQAFLKRISETHITAETYSEYISSSKARQAEIKDIGGFVGGFISNGRRIAENILHRQLITLDIDFASGDLWEDFTMLYGNAAAVYTTHKHSTESPRLRLIIPLNRPVDSLEYTAIARRIAGNIDINAFDDTTYQPHRLMYWPSTSKDGEFFFNYQDGPWLNADEVLSTYHNWQDSSEWPVSERAGTVILREIKKQGDPTEKSGIVGTFCRTYDIYQAIDKFLSDIYEPCDTDDRYTFIPGSTSAGLIVYDDGKYAYSHHGTDPVSGKLCNAFDLVRIHLFGLKDEEAKADTPNNRLPSFTSMTEFATKDPDVRKQIGIEKIQSLQGDFENDINNEDSPEDINLDWLSKLDADKHGNYRNTINNIVVTLENDPRLKGKFAFNEFENREVITGRLPWRSINKKTQYITDTDDASLRHYLEKNYDFTGRNIIFDALSKVIQDNSFHPVLDYLNAVQWDRVSRIDDLLINYLGAERTDYVRAVTRKTLVAAVARVFNPGCKFDYILVIIGRQGAGKSTLVKKIGLNWFSDSFPGFTGKDAYEAIQGVWILELAELAALGKAEFEQIKHFISKGEDRYRVAYGKRSENFPRQCIFIGTTNTKDFLRDPTGNRRFWPVQSDVFKRTKNIWEDLTNYEVNQIWAEAVVLYKQGETLYLDPSLESEALLKQTEHREIDDRTGLIQSYLDTLLPVDWESLDLNQRRLFLQCEDELEGNGSVQREFVSIAEIWCELFNKQKGDMTRTNTKELHNIMRSLPGWEEGKTGPVHCGRLYGKQRAYFRVNKSNLRQQTTATQTIFGNTE